MEIYVEIKENFEIKFTYIRHSLIAWQRENLCCSSIFRFPVSSLYANISHRGEEDRDGHGLVSCSCL